MLLKLIPFLLIALMPSLSHAEYAPTSEIHNSCYTLSTSSITTSADIASTTCQNQNGITVTNKTSHEFPSGTLIGDQTGGLLPSTTYNLNCNAPSSCYWGFGTSPSEGEIVQLRLSPGYLATPYNTLTLIYTGGTYESYYEFPFTYPIEFDAEYNTKFTGLNTLAYSTTTQTFSFNVNQYIDLTELNETVSTKNITQHYVTYNYSTNTSQFTSQGFNFTPTSGNSTTSISVQDNLFGADGVYNFKVEFGNAGTGITGIVPFNNTFMYFNFRLTSGVVSDFHLDTPYISQAFRPAITPSFDCTIYEPWECIKSLVVYLIVPPPETLGSLVWYSFASSSPAFTTTNTATGYMIETIQDATSTPQLSTLDMSIPFDLGNATMTIPIISFTGAYNLMPTQWAFLRLICLGVLVLFSLSVYVGNVQRAWAMISYKGLN